LGLEGFVTDWPSEPRMSRSPIGYPSYRLGGDNMVLGW
jgi:hypothetical protein